jgi:hypothetical protein
MKSRCSSHRGAVRAAPVRFRSPLLRCLPRDMSRNTYGRPSRSTAFPSADRTATASPLLMSESRCTMRRVIDGGSSSAPPALPSLRSDSAPRSVTWRPMTVKAFFACCASLLAGRRPGCAPPVAAPDSKRRCRLREAWLTGLLISCSSKGEIPERPRTSVATVDALHPTFLPKPDHADSQASSSACP